MRSGHLEGYPHFKTFVSAKAEMDQISRWLAKSIKLPKLLLPDGFDTISNLKRCLQAIKIVKHNFRLDCRNNTTYMNFV